MSSILGSASSGAAAGSLLGPAGTVVGGIIGAGIGMAQGAKAKKLKEDADKLNPAMEDYRMTSLLDAIKRKASAISTGSDPLAVEMNKDIASNLATTQDALTTGVGGDASSLITGLRKTMADANQAKGKVGAVLAKGAENYTGMVANLTDQISTRIMDIQMAKKMQKLRESAEMQKSSNENIAGALGGLGDLAGKNLLGEGVDLNVWEKIQSFAAKRKAGVNSPIIP